MADFLWLDTETTSLTPKDGGTIWQLAYIIEKNGKVVCERTLKCRPLDKDMVNLNSIKHSRITADELFALPHRQEAYKQFSSDIAQHSTTGKLIMAGYQVQFDLDFILSWFGKCNFESKQNLNLLNSVFIPPMDVMSLAIDYFKDEIKSANGFKLVEVAKKIFGEMDISKAHDAGFDIDITRKIYWFIKTNPR